jgi:hypothetical protein
MTQKHTDEHEEHGHHSAPKHETKHEVKHETKHDEKARDTKSQAKTHHEFKAENLTPEDRKFLEAHSADLSKTTLRARWINAVGEKQDHPGQTLATRNPDVIKHWAEERKAVPATVPGTEHGNELGVLRFNFPGYGGQKLQQVGWDQWLKTFQSRDLVFLFQQQMRDGHQSNFFHLDNPNRSHD